MNKPISHSKFNAEHLFCLEKKFTTYHQIRAPCQNVSRLTNPYFCESNRWPKHLLITFRSGKMELYPPHDWRHLLLWILLIIALLSLEDTTFLVLKNGKRIKLSEPYQVEGSLVLFKGKNNQVLRIPLKQIDLEASETATADYHRQLKRKIKPIEKPKKNKGQIPDEYFSSNEGKGKSQVYDFSEFQEKKFADEINYFDYQKAWSLYEHGKALRQRKGITDKDRQHLKDMLQHYSALIWKCKATEKKRDVDELTLEDIKRRLKEELTKQQDALAQKLAAVEAYLPKKKPKN